MYFAAASMRRLRKSLFSAHALDVTRPAPPFCLWHEAQRLETARALVSYSRKNPSTFKAANNARNMIVAAAATTMSESYAATVRAPSCRGFLSGRIDEIDVHQC